MSPDRLMKLGEQVLVADDLSNVSDCKAIDRASQQGDKIGFDGYSTVDCGINNIGLDLPERLSTRANLAMYSNPSISNDRAHPRFDLATPCVDHGFCSDWWNRFLGGWDKDDCYTVKSLGGCRHGIYCPIDQRVGWVGLRRDDV